MMVSDGDNFTFQAYYTNPFSKIKRTKTNIDSVKIKEKININVKEK